jgi:hypothetical protein|tara:strand:- start:361 stop:609 length:249 start_codon:yes stop_codon:yes gene_type:complete
MQNYKLEVDLLDVINELSTLDLIGYRMPFLTVFVEADNPDDACHAFLSMMKSAILTKDNSMEMRIFCRKINHLVRVDKVYPL